MHTSNDFFNDIQPLHTVLIPADSKVEVHKASCKNTFNTIAALYALAHEALMELKNLNLKSFDPLATDCSCHLRALPMQIMGQKLHSDPTYQNQLDQTIVLLSKQEQALYQWGKNWKPNPGTKGQVSLAEFLLKNQFAVNMPQAFAYAIQAYILTLVKDYKQVVPEDKVYCASVSCKQLLDISDKVAKEQTSQQAIFSKVSSLACVKVDMLNKAFVNNKVYNVAKEQLTKSSIKFIINQLACTDIANATLLQDSCLKKGCAVELADYYSLTAVFKVCLQQNISVILKVQKCAHAHRYQELSNPSDVALYLVPENNKFVAKELPKDEEQAVIVVEGKRSGLVIQSESTEQYLERLMKDFDFYHLCELDGAQHKQYTSAEDDLEQMPSQAIPLLQQPEYLEEGMKLDLLKKEAQQSGCSFSDQSKLVFAHIFTDTVKNQVNHLPPNLFAKTFKQISLVNKET